MQKTTTPTAQHNTTIPFPAAHGHAPAPESATAAEPPAGAPKRGRPSNYAPKVIEMICSAIRQVGLSDSAAAESVGMSSSSISRWKHDHPELKPKLKQAREDCRRRHIERIEKFAERDDAIGFRASIWLAERLFPGDYAKTQRERWACETAERQREEKEERELGDILWAEKRAAQAEERRAAAAEAAQQAAASVSDSHHVKNAGETASPGEVVDGEAPPEASTFSSGSDSHHVKNSAEAMPPGAAEQEPTRLEQATFSSEDDSHNVKNSGRPDAGPLMEAIFGPSVSDSHNVKNSPSSPTQAARGAGEVTVF